MTVFRRTLTWMSSWPYHAAQGGMVVLSGSAFRALQQQLRSGAAGVVAECAMLLHLGQHVIKPPQLGENPRDTLWGCRRAVWLKGCSTHAG